MSEPEKTRRDRTTWAPETPEGPRSSATARWPWARTRHAARGGSGCLRSATQAGDVAQAVARGQASYGVSAPRSNQKFSDGRLRERSLRCGLLRASALAVMFSGPARDEAVARMALLLVGAAVEASIYHKCN